MSSMSSAQLVVSAVAASKNIVAFTHPPPTFPYPTVRQKSNLELTFVSFRVEFFAQYASPTHTSICLLACRFNIILGHLKPSAHQFFKEITCCFREG